MSAQEALRRLGEANLKDHRRGVCGYELSSPERFAAYGLEVKLGPVIVQQTAEGAATTVKVTAVEVATGDELDKELVIHGHGHPHADEARALALRWLASASDT